MKMYAANGQINKKMNIRFCGFGGQGIVLAGYTFGTAAALDGNNVLQTQSYGSEARGGLCRSDVIISKEEIFDLAPPRFDVLVTFSQPAYDNYIHALEGDGALIVDDDLVNTGGVAPLTYYCPSNTQMPGEKSWNENKVLQYNYTGNHTHPRIFKVKATEIAYKKFGRKIMANMVMMGFLCATLEVVSKEALKQSILGNAARARGTGKINLQAFEEGYQLGNGKARS